MRAKRAIPLLLAAVTTLASGSCFPACGCMFPPAGTVRGTVKTAAGQGVPYAELTLRSSLAGRAPTRTTTSGADGTYEIRSPERTGAFELTLTPPAGHVVGPGQDNPRTLHLTESDVTEDWIVTSAP